MILPAPHPSKNTFKVVQLNAENLFLFLDDPNQVRDWRRLTEKEWQKLSRASVANKPLNKTLWLADSLLEIDADVVCMNEVGGEESLRNFARLFLEDRYSVHLIEGNSDRGIDIGYLVKKDFGLRAELRTHKNRPLQFLYPHEAQSNAYHAGHAPEKIIKSHYFSRDCAELRLYSGDPSRPIVIFLLVHLKSKLDPDGIDPGGLQRRRAELRTLTEIYSEVRAEFIPPVPVVVAGDFNGCARHGQRGSEFADLVSTDLESAMDLSGRVGDEAATQVLFSRTGNVQCLEIDYIFISPDLKPQLISESVSVFRYRSDLKIPLPIPSTIDQRSDLPSDHYPVVASFRRFF